MTWSPHSLARLPSMGWTSSPIPLSRPALVSGTDTVRWTWYTASKPWSSTEGRGRTALNLSWRLSTLWPGAMLSPWSKGSRWPVHSSNIWSELDYIFTITHTSNNFVRWRWSRISLTWRQWLVQGLSCMLSCKTAPQTHRSQPTLY